MAEPLGSTRPSNPRPAGKVTAVDIPVAGSRQRHVNAGDHPAIATALVATGSAGVRAFEALQRFDHGFALQLV